MRTRTQLINLLRAQLRQEGYRLPSGAAEAAVARYHRLSVPEALTTTLAPVLTVLEGLAPVLDAADAEATAAAAADPVVTRLMTVPGVGPITALTFRAALDDVTRFADAKAVSAYFGVVPREDSSGGRRDRGRLPRSGRGASGPCSCKARGRSGDSAAGAPRYTRGSSNSRRGAGDGSRSSPSPVDSRASSLRCGGTARRIGRRCPSKSRHTDRGGSECASRGEHGDLLSHVQTVEQMVPPASSFRMLCRDQVPSLSTNRRMSKRARMHDRRFGRTRGSQRRLTSRAAS